jgi:hypothetical protein
MRFPGKAVGARVMRPRPDDTPRQRRSGPAVAISGISHAWIAIPGAVGLIAVLWASLLSLTGFFYQRTADRIDTRSWKSLQFSYIMARREITLISVLALLSVAGFSAASFATRHVLVSVQQNR